LTVDAPICNLPRKIFAAWRREIDMTDDAVLVVIEIRSVRDPDQLTAYQTGARTQIAQYGGKVVARGAGHNTEAEPFGVLLVQSWPSERAFLRWQESEDYRPLRDLRRRCADMRIAIVPQVQAL
jgi:uncharacterized protein (DUF1330 family)